MCLNFKLYSVETVGFHILKAFVMLLRGMMLNPESKIKQVFLAPFFYRKSKQCALIVLLCVQMFQI